MLCVLFFCLPWGWAEIGRAATVVPLRPTVAGSASIDLLWDGGLPSTVGGQVCHAFMAHAMAMEGDAEVDRLCDGDELSVGNERWVSSPGEGPDFDLAPVNVDKALDVSVILAPGGDAGGVSSAAGALRVPADSSGMGHVVGHGRGAPPAPLPVVAWLSGSGLLAWLGLRCGPRRAARRGRQ